MLDKISQHWSKWRKTFSGMQEKSYLTHPYLTRGMDKNRQGIHAL